MLTCGLVSHRQARDYAAKARLTDMNGSLIKVGRTVAGVGLSLALALSTTPTVALGASSAEIQAELNSASAYLQDIALQSSQKFQELENIQADLQITRDQIVDIEGQIEVKEGELAVAAEGHLPHQIIPDRVR